jgi:tellurite resistance protein
VLPESLSSTEIEAALRAMVTVARVDGEVHAAEHAWILAAARTLGGRVSVPLDDLAPIEPDELARLVTSSEGRELVVRVMILVALMDGDVSGAEASLVERVALALRVDEPRIANLRQIEEGRLRVLWLDLARRSFARPIFEETLKSKGLRGVWKIVGPMLGLAKDPDMARRYCDLGKLPEGTLGYRYFRFIVDNELGFPGEGIVAEDGMWHDLTHVLAGYGTDPLGEVAVVSFIAGYRRDDPFFWLFTIALQFHLGIKVSPYSPGERGYFDPDVVLRALTRGLAVRRDLSREWDPWPDMARPLEDVRRELGVPP